MTGPGGMQISFSASLSCLYVGGNNALKLLNSSQKLASGVYRHNWIQGLAPFPSWLLISDFCKPAPEALIQALGGIPLTITHPPQVDTDTVTPQPRAPSHASLSGKRLELRLPLLFCTHAVDIFMHVRSCLPGEK
ncbi:hypothetical protein P7K49_013048 [Saguinus oedipus]|uniref:Uncharacterized protein n=1 Tax=Saguinus oedipus TaxID=9490 RepID=A0ABQ9VES8_SAGOE|nr:hypothetical protein P7K49_013048 [Saguinus oedipus]